MDGEILLLAAERYHSSADFGGDSREEEIFQPRRDRADRRTGRASKSEAISPKEIDRSLIRLASSTICSRALLSEKNASRGGDDLDYCEASERARLTDRCLFRGGRGGQRC